jgi:hypothetical protein
VVVVEHLARDEQLLPIGMPRRHSSLTPATTIPLTLQDH